MEQTKPWWESKTIWFNVLSGAVDLAQTLGGVGVLPPGVLPLVVAVGNVLLRIITSQPIGTAPPA